MSCCLYNKNLEVVSIDTLKQPLRIFVILKHTMKVHNAAAARYNVEYINSVIDELQ